MSSAFIADTERSLLLMRVKELEEHHATFRDSVICAFNQLLDLKDLSTVINRHPEYSWSILRLFSGLEEASLYALHHHESVDGSGYPAGLKGHDIPLVSRIVSVIDAYDAMVSSRCYRKGLPHEEAIRRLVASSGTQFDSEVVQAFIPIAEQEANEVFAAAGTS